MPRTRHSQEQHPIGQGFFYSGCLKQCSDESKHHTDELRYVYDCGSTSAIKTLRLRAQAVFDGARVPVSIEDGVRNMAVIDALFRSAESHQWETVSTA